MIKININENTIYLTESLSDTNILTLNKSKAITYNVLDLSKIKKKIEEVTKSTFKHHIFYHTDVQILFRYICSIYTSIEAAGGLVFNELDQVLFIFRNGKWDLPKGKVEPNEPIELAAVREVEEETGIIVNTLEYALVTTYHIYHINEKQILKSNHWFRMKSHSDYTLNPQLDEGIEKAIWVSKENILPLLKNSYDSIKDVIKKSF